MLRSLRARLAGSLGAQVLGAFGLTVVLTLLAALISLSATRDATLRLQALQEAERRMVSAIKDLELGAELQSDAVQAFLLSGDPRYLNDQARGQARFGEAFGTLEAHTAADEGLDRLDAIARERGVDMATLALAWLLAEPRVTAVVVGPRRPEHLEPARRALELPLSEDERDELGRLFDP